MLRHPDAKGAKWEERPQGAEEPVPEVNRFKAPHIDPDVRTRATSSLAEASAHRVVWVITAIHNLIYSDDPPATRAFLRDVLRWPFVEDAGSDDGWLIFKTGPSELGVHPTSGGEGDDTWKTPRHHDLTLVCDDLAATVDELKANGATFTSEIRDQGFGLVVMLAVPGADDIMVYEPRHTTAYGL